MRAVLSGLILIVFAVAASSAAAEDPSDWFNVPSEQSGLVIVINGDLKGSKVILTSASDKYVDAVGWDLELPFVKQYRVAPGEYKILLPDPVINSVSVIAKQGSLSVLEITPLQTSGNKTGIQISGYSTETAKELLSNLIEQLYKVNYSQVIAPLAISPEANIIRVNTEPPWPIPPPPKP